MKIKIDILKELEKIRKKDAIISVEKLEGLQLPYAQAEALLYGEPQNRQLLEKAGFTLALEKQQQAVEQFRKAESETMLHYSGEDSPLFHINHISALADHCNLHLVVASRFPFLPPRHSLEKLIEVEEQYNSERKGNERAFVLYQKEGQGNNTGKCLLFYRISNELFYFCSQWGEDMKVSFIDKHKATLTKVKGILPEKNYWKELREWGFLYITGAALLSFVMSLFVMLSAPAMFKQPVDYLFMCMPVATLATNLLVYYNSKKEDKKIDSKAELES